MCELCGPALNLWAGPLFLVARMRINAPKCAGGTHERIEVRDERQGRPVAASEAAKSGLGIEGRRGQRLANDEGI